MSWSTASTFRIAFDRWVDGKNRRDLPELLQGSLDRLKPVTARVRANPPGLTPKRKATRGRDVPAQEMGITEVPVGVGGGSTGAQPGIKTFLEVGPGKAAFTGR